MGFKSWKMVPIAACVWGVCPCGGSDNGASMQNVNPPSTSGTSGSGGQAPSAGSAGAQAAGAGAVSAAGSVAVTPPANPTAVAMINSFTAPKSSATGGAGAAGSMAAGSGAKAGSGGTSQAGAGGTGSGAGFAVVYGQASFTMVSSTEVFFQIEIMGGDNNQSYPVFLHEGMSCDSVMSQGGHWARGEGLPDIQCKGTTGVSSGKRDASDKRLQWTVGTMDESDVVGHLVVVHDGTDPIACGKIELKK